MGYIGCCTTLVAGYGVMLQFVVNNLQQREHVKCRYCWALVKEDGKLHERGVENAIHADVDRSGSCCLFLFYFERWWNSIPVCNLEILIVEGHAALGVWKVYLATRSLLFIYITYFSLHSFIFQGTLIQHLKEHILHGNTTSNDVIMYYTTASGAYDIYKTFF